MNKNDILDAIKLMQHATTRRKASFYIRITDFVLTVAYSSLLIYIIIKAIIWLVTATFY
jgi:hypothetical protein